MKLKTVSKIGFNCEPFNDMVVFDLETTGLSSRRHEIIQIAAMRISDGEIQPDDSFFSYVKPQASISRFITSYTGITNEDVKDAPMPKDVLPDFSKYCGDSLLVAHNGQRFDLPFVMRTCERHNIKTRRTHYIDSIHLSWNVWGRREVPSHNLDSVISRLKVSDDGVKRHDARGDVDLTAKCVCRMIDKLGKKTRDTELGIYSCVLPQL